MHVFVYVKSTSIWKHHKALFNPLSSLSLYRFPYPLPRHLRLCAAVFQMKMDSETGVVCFVWKMLYTPYTAAFELHFSSLAKWAIPHILGSTTTPEIRITFIIKRPHIYTHAYIFIYAYIYQYIRSLIYHFYYYYHCCYVLSIYLSYCAFVHIRFIYMQSQVVFSFLLLFVYVFMQQQQSILRASEKKEKMTILRAFFISSYFFRILNVAYYIYI